MKYLAGAFETFVKIKQTYGDAYEALKKTWLVL